MKKVCKFGGSSLATFKNFKKVKKIIESDNERKVIVVSAMGKSFLYRKKITDLLIELFKFKSEKVYKRIKRRYCHIAKKIKTNLDIEKEFQILDNALRENNYESTISFGEYLCAKLFAQYLSFKFLDSKNLIFFDKNHKIDEKKTEKALKSAIFNENVVIPGFYGSDEFGNVKLMDRGGSDTAGAVVSKLLNIDIYEVWSDVDGLYVCNPRIVKNHCLEEEISLKKLSYLVKYGTPILNFECVEYLFDTSFDLQFKNTFRPNRKGTKIVKEEVVNFAFSGKEVDAICETCLICPKQFFDLFLKKSKYVLSFEEKEDNVFLFRCEPKYQKRIYKSLYSILKKAKKRKVK